MTQSPTSHAAIHWGASNPKYSISYVDSLFLVVSAMTEAGLNTVSSHHETTSHLCTTTYATSDIYVYLFDVFQRINADHISNQKSEYPLTMLDA